MEKMSREEILALADINPEFEEVLKNSPPAEVLDVNTDIPAYRAKIKVMKEAYITAQPPIEGVLTFVEEDQQIPMRDGALITIRIHRPREPPADGCPMFVVYHSGGFVFGDLDSETVLCRQWTDLGGVAVNVAYRMAPEHPFPVPVNDAYDALKWTASHMPELNGNPKKGFLVGGVSAGGNFTVVVSHLYRDQGLTPPLTGLYASIPSTCAPDVLPAKYKDLYLSREQNKDAPILGQGIMALFAKCYNADLSSPLRSPLLFPSHKGLPPTYFQICGMDPLRDEALIYDRILREECGIETKVDVYPGLPHGFWISYPEANFTKKMQKDSVEGLKWLLEQSKAN